MGRGWECVWCRSEWLRADLFPDEVFKDITKALLAAAALTVLTWIGRQLYFAFRRIKSANRADYDNSRCLRPRCRRTLQRRRVALAWATRAWPAKPIVFPSRARPATISSCCARARTGRSKVRVLFLSAAGLCVAVLSEKMFVTTLFALFCTFCYKLFTVKRQELCHGTKAYKPLLSRSNTDRDGPPIDRDVPPSAHQPRRL